MMKDVRTADQTPSFKEAWARNGSDVPNMVGAEFGRFVTAEIGKWGKVV
jgi:hypothetical protein